MTDRPAPQSGDRLAKVIARAGYASRRDAEGLITDGRVAVNGKIIRTAAFNVTDKDKIEIDGRPMTARQGTRLWLYHKPAGLVVTEKDPEGRPTIFEALEERGLPRVMTVGRLDINTEGLLLLTNDGGLKRVLELPSTGWMRRYRVRAFGSVSQEQLDALKDGIEVEGVRYGPIEATLEREQGSNVWLVFGLREGKNREVKNVLGALGLAVNRLIRVSYGPFQLGDLPEGAVETVRARTLREQLGQRLAREAGVDFDSDLPDALPAETERPQRRRSEPEGFRRDRPQRDARPPRGAAPSRGPRSFDRDAEAPRRRVHFDQSEGRDSEMFTPKAVRPDRDRDERPARGGKPFRSARPEGASGDRPKRPFKPRAEGQGDARPFRPRRDDAGSADRPRRPFKAREEGGDDRPKRAFKPRTEGSTGADFGARPKRPYKPREEGSSSTGFVPRPKRAFGKEGGDAASRPPRRPRPAGDGDARPARPARSSSGPRKEGGYASRGDRPARSGAPRSGPRPGGGASRPSGPRKGPRPPRKPEA